MKRIKLVRQTEVTVKGIQGFIIRKVTPFGNGAKVDCPKEYLGRTVYLVVCDE